MTAPLNKHIQAHLIDMVKEKLLLERITLNGVDVNRTDTEGKNALYWAIKNRSTHNANLLISFGSSLLVTEEEHALFHAIACKNHEILVLLIDRGADINITDDTGKTLLMCAIEEEMFDTVKFLISNGADMYMMDDALNMAEDYAKACKSDIIKSYLQHIVYRDMQEDTSRKKTCS